MYNVVDKGRQRRVHGCWKDNHSFGSWRFYQKFPGGGHLLQKLHAVETKQKIQVLRSLLVSGGIGSTYDRCIFESAPRIAFGAHRNTGLDGAIRSIGYTRVSRFNLQFADGRIATRRSYPSSGAIVFPPENFWHIDGTIIGILWSKNIGYLWIRYFNLQYVDCGRVRFVEVPWIFELLLSPKIFYLSIDRSLEFY